MCLALSKSTLRPVSGSWRALGTWARSNSRFGPEVSWEELQRRKVRLRLVELERGAVNVVLMRSRFPEIRLGQLGLVINEVERERILGRAKADGIRVRDHDFRWLLAAGQRLTSSCPAPSATLTAMTPGPTCV